MEQKPKETMTKTEQVVAMIGLVLFFVLIGFAARSCDILAFTKF